MKRINVQVRGKSVEGYSVFAVISPRGGARLIDTDMLEASDKALFEALVAGAQHGSVELSIEEMKRVAALGTEIEAPVSVQVPAPSVEASPVVEPGARSRPLEAIQAAVMEPDMHGTYREVGVAKHAHMCLACGLVWQIKWHADTCGDRGHKAAWKQRYCAGTVINGKPEFETFYDRIALRREPVA